MFLGTALISVLALRNVAKHPRLALAGVVPQQAVLLWGVIWGLLILLESAVHADLDVRTLLGCCYLTVLAAYHGAGVRTLWAVAWSPRGAG